MRESRPSLNILKLVNNNYKVHCLYREELEQFPVGKQFPLTVLHNTPVATAHSKVEDKGYSHDL